MKNKKVDIVKLKRILNHEKNLAKKQRNAILNGYRNVGECRPYLRLFMYALVYSNLQRKFALPV